MSAANNVNKELIDGLVNSDKGNDAVAAQLKALADQMKALTEKQAALEAENKGLRDFRDHTKKIVDAPADQVDPNALRAVLKGVGLSDAEIDQRLASEEPEPKGKGAAKDEEFNQLKKKVDDVDNRFAQTRAQVLRERFNQGIEKAVLGDAAFAKIHAKLVADGKTAEAEKLKTTAIRLVENSAMRALNDAHTATKAPVDEATIDSVIPKVSGDLTTLTSAIETTAFAGRSPDTGVNEWQTVFGSKKPVEEPKFKGTEDIGDVEAGLDAWAADRIGRELLAADTATESKA